MQTKRIVLICFTCLAFFSLSCAKEPGDKKPKSVEAPSSDESEDQEQSQSKEDDSPEKVFSDQEGVVSKNKVFAVKLEWTNGPVALGLCSARLQFASSDRFAVSNVEVKDFIPFMPSMDHGTDMTDQVISLKEGSTSEFSVDGIYFVMGGPWEITISAQVEGKTDTAAIAVEVP